MTEEDNSSLYTNIFLKLILPMVTSVLLGIASMWFQKRSQLRNNILHNKWELYKTQHQTLIKLNLMLNRHRQMYSRFESIENGTYSLDSSPDENELDDNLDRQSNLYLTTATLGPDKNFTNMTPNGTKFTNKNRQSIQNGGCKTLPPISETVTINVDGKENKKTELSGIVDTEDDTIFNYINMDNKSNNQENDESRHILANMMYRYIKIVSGIMILGKQYERNIIENLREIRNLISENIHVLSPDREFDNLIFELDRFITAFCSLKSTENKELFPHKYYGAKFPHAIYGCLKQKRDKLFSQLIDIENEI